MAKPLYIIKNGTEQKTVTSKEMVELTSQDWELVGKADVVKKKETKSIETPDTPVIETYSPQFTQEQEKDKSPEIECNEPEIEVKQEQQIVPEKENDSDGIPKNLKCPHCNAVAKTKASYERNHGDNCIRKKIGNKKKK